MNREHLATVFRDWIHEQPFSKCNMGCDSCPDWDMAYELADLVEQPPSTGDDYPRGCKKPAFSDTVQVMMTEQMARMFERRCLGIGNTVGDTTLVGPVVFASDDLPTYIIGVTDAEAAKGMT